MIAEPRSHYVRVDGARMHVAEWLPASGRPAGADRAALPVVLVHGLGGCTINWHLVGQPLADALGTTVNAVDLIGFGRTTTAERSTLDANTRLLAAYLRSIGPSVLVGNSMGGTVALRCAVREPDHVASLVLVNPALPFVRRFPSPRHMRNLAVFAAASIPLAGPWLIDARARRLGAERVVDLSLRASGVDPDSFDGGVRNALIELTAARYADGVAGRAYHDAIRTTLPYLATTMASDIATVRARTLVVHGRDDPLVPLALAEAVSRQRPDWRIEVLECGHLPLFEAPGLLVEVVAGWLADAPTRPEPTRPEPKTA